MESQNAFKVSDDVQVSYCWTWWFARYLFMYMDSDVYFISRGRGIYGILCMLMALFLKW